MATAELASIRSGPIRRALDNLQRQIGEGGGNGGGPPGPQGPPGVVQAVLPGANVTVDNTNPAYPVVASTGGGGTDNLWNTAWGLLAVASINTSQSGITAEVPVTGSALSVVTQAGRRYKLALTVSPSYTTLDCAAGFTIRRDGTRLLVKAMDVPAAGRSQVLSTWMFYDETADGVRNFDATMFRQVGTGTVGNYADAQVITSLSVEDVGPVVGAIPVPNPARPYAVGLRQRVIKATTETGFGATEYSTGLDLTVGANDVNRWLQVQFSLRVIPVAQPSNANSIFIVRQRLGSLTGTYVTAVQFPFPLNASIYGYNLIGTFTPAGYNPGPLVTTIQTDGTGTFKLAAGDTWAALYDMGPTS